MSEAYNIMAHIMETVGRTGYDREFREKFLADPRAAFLEEGIQVPEDMEISLVMDEPGKLMLLVPLFNDQPVEIRADHPLLRD